MEPPLSEPLENLDRSIFRAHVFVGVFALFTLLIYVVWFWAIQRFPLAESVGAWGTFGDFLGGILNPIVAYAAFYWLTQSVRLQKQELSETRRALRDTATSQVEAAGHAKMSVRLGALTAPANSITAEISSTRLEMQYVVDQITRDPSRGGARTIGGNWLGDNWTEYLTNKNREAIRRLADQASIEHEVRELLNLHR